MLRSYSSTKPLNSVKEIPLCSLHYCLFTINYILLTFQIVNIWCHSGSSSSTKLSNSVKRPHHEPPLFFVYNKLYLVDISNSKQHSVSNPGSSSSTKPSNSVKRSYRELPLLFVYISN